MKIETLNTFNENLKENSFGRQYFSDKVHTLKPGICVHEKIIFLEGR